MARVAFNYSGDTRRSGDFDIYQVNPRGWIEGRELLVIARPAERAIFEAYLGLANPTREKVDRLYEEYRRRSAKGRLLAGCRPKARLRNLGRALRRRIVALREQVPSAVAGALLTGPFAAAVASGALVVQEGIRLLRWDGMSELVGDSFDSRVARARHH